MSCSGVHQQQQQQQQEQQHHHYHYRHYPPQSTKACTLQCTLDIIRIMHTDLGQIVQDPHDACTGTRLGRLKLPAVADGSEGWPQRVGDRYAQSDSADLWSAAKRSKISMMGTNLRKYCLPNPEPENKSLHGTPCRTILSTSTRNHPWGRNSNSAIRTIFWDPKPSAGGGTSTGDVLKLVLRCARALPRSCKHPNHFQIWVQV